jgi:hypothetical protein
VGINTVNRSQTHECGNRESGTEAAQFLFWEYLFRIFSIVSLQCNASQEVTTDVGVDLWGGGDTLLYTTQSSNVPI